MILTDEEIDALLPKITLKGMGPKQQVRLTKKDAIAFVRAAEAAVIAKLCAGVEMPEPEGYKFSRPGITKLDAAPHGGDWFSLYSADQLRTCIAAARVKALEDAALNCEELHWTWRMGDNSGPKECAEKIRTLKGGA